MYRRILCPTATLPSTTDHPEHPRLLGGCIKPVLASRPHTEQVHEPGTPCMGCQVWQKVGSGVGSEGRRGGAGQADLGHDRTHWLVPVLLLPPASFLLGLPSLMPHLQVASVHRPRDAAAMVGSPAASHCTLLCRLPSARPDPHASHFPPCPWPSRNHRCTEGRSDAVHGRHLNVGVSSDEGCMNL